ncbi:MAG: hypothetical protein GX891_00895 [Clostridiales bacterium]|nr:hypothetical protein [Clostridiales bacterium]
MSNVKHPKCKIRVLAAEAKARLVANNYKSRLNVHSQGRPVSLSPAEVEVYKKMRAILEKGEEIINPIAQLCDKAKLDSLDPIERQRYILELSNAYLSLKEKMMERLEPVLA